MSFHTENQIQNKTKVYLHKSSDGKFASNFDNFFEREKRCMFFVLVQTLSTIDNFLSFVLSFNTSIHTISPGVTTCTLLRGLIIYILLIHVVFQFFHALKCFVNFENLKTLTMHVRAQHKFDTAGKFLHIALLVVIEFLRQIPLKLKIPMLAT